MELTGKAQMEKTSAGGEASSGVRDIPRRERIALAADEFYESIADEIMYIAEWYEIEANELVRAIVTSTGGEGTETQDPSDLRRQAGHHCAREKSKMPP